MLPERTAASASLRPIPSMLRARSLPLAASVVSSLLLGACGQEQQTKATEAKVAEAAAKIARATRTLGPGDLQMVSLDRTVAIEVVGDSAHIFMANSQISVPVTYIENVKFADNRLRFDIKGFGMKVFEVGDGTEGAVFSTMDALAFVQTVVSRQNALEKQP